MKDLSVRPEMVKLLEENRGSKLPDIGWSNDFFFAFDIKSKATKPRANGTTSN